ncbi:hypothetical protein EC9_01840 [Rosistilla ulvae]|uniref:Uncharacterized protein n=1 Tax=Rosistilla ulvae TaxID=1930277 RepID=A0A517LTU0_9BACT|nr:hypothetical protein [Rosistilla ulvae]QDS86026.1 hypothetical protein EC9_01840 [Rosistilla ulvae]
MPKKSPRREDAASASTTSASESSTAAVAPESGDAADSATAAEDQTDAPHRDEEKSSDDETETVGDENLPSESGEVEASEPEVDGGSGSLLDDVQAFFDQREELAQRLTDEIEATQAKLAELQETLAQLHPERSGSAGKERRPKKAKKPAVRNSGSAAEAKPDA